MNPKGNKFIALFLIFSLVSINCTILKTIEEKREKRKKHGAMLLIQKIDGEQLIGELIAVKESSFLLLDKAARTDVSIDISDVKAIMIIKKKGAFSGFLVGAGSGASSGAGIWLRLGLIAFPLMSLGEESWVDYLPGFVVIGACIGALIGGATGTVAGIDKTIQIEGKSDLEIREVLEKLHKKARIPDYK